MLRVCKESPISITLALTAVLLFTFTDTCNQQARLLYSRAALLEGEYWRLLSGHLMHFSWQHLLSDSLAFVVLAAVLERQLGSLRLLVLLAILASACSLVLLLGVPAMAYYGGLSALNYGLLTLVVLKQASSGRPGVVTAFQRCHAALPLLLIPVLLLHALWQGWFGVSLLSAAEKEAVPAWQAHSAAVVLALLLYLLSDGMRRPSADAGRQMPALPRLLPPAPR